MPLGFRCLSNKFHLNKLPASFKHTHKINKKRTNGGASDVFTIFNICSIYFCSVVEPTKFIMKEDINANKSQNKNT